MALIAAPSPTPTGPSVGVEAVHNPAFWIVVAVLAFVFLLIRAFDRRNR